MRGPRKLAIFGAGGHGLVLADSVLASGENQLVGFLSDGETSCVDGVAPLLGDLGRLGSLISSKEVNALAIGIGDNHVRIEVMCRLRADFLGAVEFPMIVHATVTLGVKSSLGLGSVLLAGAVVGPGAVVGEGCLLNTGATLDHHGSLGDYASLAPGVVTGGNVRIGEGSAVSIGATVLHGRSVGDWSVVGAGSTVIDDVPNGVVAYGTPARVVRESEAGDPYL